MSDLLAFIASSVIIAGGVVLKPWILKRPLPHNVLLSLPEDVEPWILKCPLPHNVLISLPEDVVMFFLSNWLEPNDVMLLDWAMCNSKLRPILLTLLSDDRVVLQNSFLSIPWICKRMIGVNEIRSQSVADIEHLRNTPNYLRMKGHCIKIVNTCTRSSELDRLIRMYCVNLENINNVHM